MIFGRLYVFSGYRLVVALLLGVLFYFCSIAGQLIIKCRAVIRCTTFQIDRCGTLNRWLPMKGSFIFDQEREPKRYLG
jgi:hypothetical protein